MNKLRKLYERFDEWFTETSPEYQVSVILVILGISMIICNTIMLFVILGSPADKFERCCNFHFNNCCYCLSDGSYPSDKELEMMPHMRCGK